MFDIPMNLKSLEDAESALAYLKRQQEQQKPVEPETPPTSSSSSSTETESGCGSSIEGIGTILGVAGLSSLAIIKNKRKEKENEK